MIELVKVSKQYLVGQEVVTVLDGVDLRIAAGEFVSIVGPSGSGKSTLMHIMGCLDVPTSGQYVLCGQVTGTMTSASLAAVRNRHIGFVFQHFHLLARMTALQNVELPLAYAGVSRKERRARAVESLRTVGLADRMLHLPGALSGGQRQRVAIARALVNHPSLVLADEPTGALDSATGHGILRLFQQLREQGVTVVVITHDASVAATARRTVTVRDGRIVDGHSS